jgi:hypothetical protein
VARSKKLNQFPNIPISQFYLMHSFVRLLRNVSAIGECVRQTMTSTVKGQSIVAERAWIKTELSDCLIAIKRMSQILQIDYKELEQLGYERNKECIKECGDCNLDCYKTK